jgi:hypothetical protein
MSKNEPPAPLSKEHSVAAPRKDRIYLFALFVKAFKEFSLIEVVGEAGTGVILGVIAYLNNWISSESAFELVLEGIGCAMVMPVLVFILRVVFAAPAELLKESEENKTGEKINPKSIYPSLVTMLLGFCAILLIGFVFSLKLKFPKHEEKQVVIQTDTNQIIALRSDLANAVKNSDDYAELINKMVSPTNTHLISSDIEVLIAKRQEAWQDRNTNIPTDAMQRLQQVHESAQHDRDQNQLEFLAQKARDLESLQAFYPTCVGAIDRLKHLLFESAKRHGGEVMCDKLPSVQEVWEEGIINRYITLGTNSLWKCRCEFKRDLQFNLDCSGSRSTRSFLSLLIHRDNLLIQLKGIDLNAGSAETMLFSTNCPINSVSDCVENIDTALQFLCIEQQNEF